LLLMLLRLLASNLLSGGCIPSTICLRPASKLLLLLLLLLGLQWILLRHHVSKAWPIVRHKLIHVPRDKSLGVLMLTRGGRHLHLMAMTWALIKGELGAIVEAESTGCRDIVRADRGLVAGAIGWLRDSMMLQVLLLGMLLLLLVLLVLRLRFLRLEKPLMTGDPLGVKVVI
jgi:hypothetical protein